MPPEGSEIFHQRENLFFSFPGCLWWENRRRKVVRLIDEGTVKVCLQHFRLEELRKCGTIAFTSKSVSFSLMLSLVSMIGRGGGVVEVHLLGDICFARFSLSKVQADFTNFFWDRMSFKRNFSLLRRRYVLAMQSCWHPARHHIRSSFNWFCKIFQTEKGANKLQFPRRSWTHFLRLDKLQGSTIFLIAAKRSAIFS